MPRRAGGLQEISLRRMLPSLGATDQDGSGNGIQTHGNDA